MHVIETALCTLNCCLKSLFRIIYEAHLGVMKGKNFRKFEKISFFFCCCCKMSLSLNFDSIIPKTTTCKRQRNEIVKMKEHPLNGLIIDQILTKGCRRRAFRSVSSLEGIIWWLRERHVCQYYS